MRTFAIHDVLKRFAEGEFDASQDMTGSLNGPMSRLHEHLTEAMNSEVEEMFEDAKGDLQAEIDGLETEVSDLKETFSRQRSNGTMKPCPRCGGQPMDD